MERKKPKRTRCPACRGTGVDRSLHRRYTTGGHDDRTCKRCNGECYIDEPDEPGEAKEEMSQSARRR